MIHTTNQNLPPFIQAMISGGKPTRDQFLRSSGIDPLTRQPAGVPSNTFGPASNPVAAAMQTNTPGFNPAAPPIPQVEPKPNFLEKLLDNPFLFNLLAQQGNSLTPGPGPFGVIGRALVATNQQKQQQEGFDLQRRLLESQIGLNTAKAGAERDGGAPLTDLAKLAADFQAGRISQEVYDAKVNDVLSIGVEKKFQQTQDLRQEYNKETSGIRNSLQSLTAAQSLLADGSNPIAELAAFISTIKSIDNSTVREGELRNFNKAVGIVGQLENLVERAKGEGFSETMAQNIADTVARLRVPLEQVLEGSREFYSSEATKFKLDPASITGGAVPEAVSVGNVRSDPIDGTVPTPESLQAQSAELDREIAEIDRQLAEEKRKANGNN